MLTHSLSFLYWKEVTYILYIHSLGNVTFDVAVRQGNALSGHHLRLFGCVPAANEARSDLAGSCVAAHMCDSSRKCIIIVLLIVMSS